MLFRSDPAGRGVVDELECQVGARTSDVSQLEECTANLSARSPDDATTVTYLWALAVAEHRFDSARGEIVRARAAGVPDGPLAAMERTTASTQSRARWRFALEALAAALLAALIVLAAVRTARVLRRPALGGAAAEP